MNKWQKSNLRDTIPGCMTIFVFPMARERDPEKCYQYYIFGKIKRKN